MNYLEKMRKRQEKYKKQFSEKEKKVLIKKAVKNIVKEFKKSPEPKVRPSYEPSLSKKVETEVREPFYEYEWERNLTGRQRSNLKKVKSSFYFKDLINKGLIPFTTEWRAYSQRISKNHYYKNSPDKRKQRNEKSAKRRLKNIEKQREKERIWKAKQKARRGKEAVNAIQREHYSRERLVNAAKQRERRYVREPHRQIRAHLNLYLTGLLTYEQYVESVNECVKRAEQAEHTGLGKRKKRRETP
jgi:hypothetical protein